MSEAQGITIAFNVRLKPVDYSNPPHQANYGNVAAAQEIAYLDFSYIEPAVLGAVAKAAKGGPVVPNAIEGQLVARVAMSIDVLTRLHQQIQQVLVDLREARQGMAKA